MFAQVNIRGIVYAEDSNKTISNVFIQHKESNRWCHTNENGIFKLKIPDIENFELYISHLSYEDKTLSFSSKNSRDIKVYLEESNLRIAEINLIGTHKKHSEITLKAEAIDNVQSFTALEVLEQLPGQSTSEPNLNGYKNIVFRTAEVGLTGDESYGNKAFGTAIVVNDIPLSNNENLQSWAPNSSGVFNNNFGQFTADTFGDYSSTSYSNAGFGSDLREIPTENIDEIEVVQGIPDAKYGDLTSGLVKIKTKAGVTPFISSVSFRDGSTQFNASKGFKISDKLGFINIGASYLNSKNDPKEVLDQFNRINLNTNWSVIGNKTNNHFSVTLSSSLDDGRQDPDDISESFVKNENKGITLSNRFSYKIKKWVDEISVNSSFSYKKQHSIRRQLINNGGEVIPASLEPGIFEGIYTPVSYYAVREIDGKPINGFLDAQLSKSFSSPKKWQHSIIAGATLRYSNNIGEGRIGTPETADNQFTLDAFGDSGIGFRPYSFNENLRAELQLATYIQDNVVKHWNENTYSLSAGLRLDNQNSYNVVSPRVNTFFKRNNYKIRGGIGLASKAPSLNSLYTGKQYFDFLIGDFRTQNYNVAYIQTFVKDEQNLDLKPTKSLNTEFGFDYNFLNSQLSVTGFYRKLWDGLTDTNVFNSVIGDAYEVISNEPEAPTIEITGESLYAYENSRTINGLTSKDYGLELLYKTGKIQPLNIDVTLNALYAKTISNNTSDIFSRTSTESEIAQIGVFAESPIAHKELFRLGTSINYHISKVGLLVNLRTEHFLIENEYSEHISIYPMGYYDIDYNYFEIPQEDRNNEQLYGHLFRNQSAFEEEELDVAHNLHLRISKDFTNGFRVDFYASNFLNIKPTVIEPNGEEQLRDNFTSLSFGMKLNYKF